MFGLGGIIERRRDGRGGLHRGDLLLAIGLFGDPEFLVHLHLELVGGAAELAHPLAEFAGQHGQLLGPEEQKGQHEQKDAVGKAWHTTLDDTALGTEAKVVTRNPVKQIEGWRVHSGENQA